MDGGWKCSDVELISRVQLPSQRYGHFAKSHHMRSVVLSEGDGIVMVLWFSRAGKISSSSGATRRVLHVEL